MSQSFKRSTIAFCVNSLRSFFIHFSFHKVSLSAIRFFIYPFDSCQVTSTQLTLTRMMPSGVGTLPIGAPVAKTQSYL
jgi:hypothetical protein